MSLTPISSNIESSFENSNKDFLMCNKPNTECREETEETSTEEAEEIATSDDEYIDIENCEDDIKNNDLKNSDEDDVKNYEGDDDDDDEYEDIDDDEDELSPSERQTKSGKRVHKNHNHIEKLRRNELNACFTALKEAINQPTSMPHIKALSYASQLIDQYHARNKKLDEKIKESNQKLAALGIHGHGRIVSGKPRNFRTD